MSILANTESNEHIAKQLTEVCARLYLSINEKEFTQKFNDYQFMFLCFEKYISSKLIHYYFDDMIIITHELRKLNNIQTAEVLTQIIDRIDHEHHGHLRDELNYTIIEENAYLFDKDFHDQLTILPIFGDTYRRQQIK